MKKNKYPEPLIIPEKLKEDVIVYFRFEVNNTTRDLMEVFNIDRNVADKIINDYMEQVERRFKNKFKNK